MNRLANTVALKGQSRSTFCAERVDGTASLCHRLLGHKGDHRATMQSIATAKPVKRAKARTRRRGLDLNEVEALVIADTEKAVAKRQRRKVRRIPAAKTRRVVAAPARRARRVRTARQSSRPTLSRPAVG